MALIPQRRVTLTDLSKRTASTDALIPLHASAASQMSHNNVTNPGASSGTSLTCGISHPSTQSIIHIVSSTFRGQYYTFLQASPTRKKELILQASICFLLVWTFYHLFCDLWAFTFYVPRYANKEQLEFRVNRFPSVEDRVKLYMSHWYLPPCSDHDKVVYRRLNITAPPAFEELSTTSTSKSFADIGGGFFDFFFGASNSSLPLDGNISAPPKFALDYFEVTELAWPTSETSLTSQSVRPPPRTFAVGSRVEIGRVFSMNEIELAECHEKDWSIRFYCSDSLETISANVPFAMASSLSQSIAEPGSDSKSILEPDSQGEEAIISFPPVLLQYSDETESVVEEDSFLPKGTNVATTSAEQPRIFVNPRLPHIKKIRRAMDAKQLQELTGGEGSFTCRSRSTTSPSEKAIEEELQPILWKLNVARHFGYLKLVKKFDRQWSSKMDKAVFRGHLTGLHANDDDGNVVKASDHEICQLLPRCRLVYQYDASELVDAKLTSTLNKTTSEMIGTVNVTSEIMLKEELLAYKGIIILEGNDVSSGLKWALLSQSVVLMPPPTITSWAMEELLEPWMHYIPLQPDLSDVEEKIEWMIEHDAEAQRISHRAFLWIMDMVYHPDAEEDDRRIYQEILRRYRAHFMLAE